MASAWGNSWGKAWGNSWGSGVTPPTPEPVYTPSGGVDFREIQLLAERRKRNLQNNVIALLFST